LPNSATIVCLATVTVGWRITWHIFIDCF